MVSTTALYSVCRSASEVTLVLVRNSTPSADICAMRRVDDVFLHLEVRNAVAEQAADAIGLFKQSHPMTGSGKLLRRGHTRRSGADDRDAFAGADGGRFGQDPTLLEGVIDDALLDVLDGDRRFVDAEHTR